MKTKDELLEQYYSRIKILVCPICLDFKMLCVIPLNTHAWSKYDNHVELCMETRNDRY